MKNFFKVMMLAVVVLLGTSVATANSKKAMSQSKSNTTTLVSAQSQSNYAGLIMVTGNGVRIRATPSLKGKVVGHANYGWEFENYGYVDGGNGRYGWFKIYYKGHYRYISAQYAYAY